MAHSGYLVIADITGYTAYLSDSELEHAKDSLNSLLKLLIEYTKRPLLISRLEGDAVISYALDDNVSQGQTLVELVENTYVAFRKARELMIVNTTCECRACANIPNLDLKFFVHHGTYSFQHLDNYTELLGADVNLVHRLTKNSIVEVTGFRAYTAYTKAAINALGIEPEAAGWAPHNEEYEHIGQVQIYVQDLNRVWKREKEALHYEVRPDNTVYQYEALFPIEPEMLWDYLVRPEIRALLNASDGVTYKARPGGRSGPGTVYECAHGKRIATNAVIDWNPFKQITTLETTPIPRASGYATLALEPVEGGTRLAYSWSKALGPPILRHLCDLGSPRAVGGFIPDGMAKLQKIVEDDLDKAIPTYAETPALAVEQAVADSLSR